MIYLGSPASLNISCAFKASITDLPHVKDWTFHCDFENGSSTFLLCHQVGHRLREFLNCFFNNDLIILISISYLAFQESLYSLPWIDLSRSNNVGIQLVEYLTTSQYIQERALAFLLCPPYLR